MNLCKLIELITLHLNHVVKFSKLFSIIMLSVKNHKIKFNRSVVDVLVNNFSVEV